MSFLDDRFFDNLHGLYTERGAQRYEINGRVGGVTQLQHEITIEDATATAFSRMLEFLYRWRQHFATVFPFVCDAAQR